MAEVLFRAKLQREDSNTPWGFRLQGGVEYNKPLTLLKVTGDSLAYKGGLHAGDKVVKLAGLTAEEMTHKDAQQTIISAANALEIIVERPDETVGSPASSSSEDASDSSENEEYVNEDTATKRESKVEQDEGTSEAPSTAVSDSNSGGLEASDLIAKQNEREEETKKDTISQVCPETSLTEHIPAPDSVTDTVQEKHVIPKAMDDSVTFTAVQADQTPHTAIGVSGAKDTEESLAITSIQEEKTPHTTLKVAGGNDVEASLELTSIQEEQKQDTKSCPKVTDREILEPKLDSKTVMTETTPSILSNAPLVQEDLTINTICDIPSSVKNEPDVIVANVIGTKEDTDLTFTPTASKEHKSTTLSEVSVVAKAEKPNPSVHVASVTELVKPSDITPGLYIIQEDQESATVVASDTTVAISPDIPSVPNATPEPVISAKTTKETTRDDTIAVEQVTVSAGPQADILVVEEQPHRILLESDTNVPSAIPVKPVSHEFKPEATFTPPRITFENSDIVPDTTHIVNLETVPLITEQPCIQPIEIKQLPPEHDEIRIKEKPSSYKSETLDTGQDKECREKESIVENELVTSSATIAGDLTTDSVTVPSTGIVEKPSQKVDDTEMDSVYPWRKARRDSGTPSKVLESVNITTAETTVSKAPLDSSFINEQPITSKTTSDIPVEEFVLGFVPKYDREKFVKDDDKSITGSYTSTPSDITPTLTFVGRRIETRIGSPTVKETHYKYTEQHTAPTPATRLEPQFAQPKIYPGKEMFGTMAEPPVSSQVANTIPQSESPSGVPEEQFPGVDDIVFTAADPDLIGVTMPAVKNMVADLNRRLDTIAYQHPKIAEPATLQEVGLDFLKKKAPAAPKTGLTRPDEKEVFIDTAPPGTGGSMGAIKQRLFGDQPSDTSTYQKLYDVTCPITSPPPYRKEFAYSAQTLSPKSAQRRVHFADPVESSVIEIEPTRRPSRRKARRASFDAATIRYSSPLSLAAKLDRIERENAMSASALSNAMAAAEASALSRAKPEPMTENVVYSTSEPRKQNLLVSSYKPPVQQPSISISTPRGKETHGQFAFSIGQAPSPLIKVKLEHHRGKEKISQEYSFPPKTAAQPGRVTYSISPNKAQHPLTFSYSFPQDYGEPIRIRPQPGRLRSLDDSTKVIHFTYPPVERPQFMVRPDGHPKLTPLPVRHQAPTPQPQRLHAPTGPMIKQQPPAVQPSGRLTPISGPAAFQAPPTGRLSPRPQEPHYSVGVYTHVHPRHPGSGSMNVPPGSPTPYLNPVQQAPPAQVEPMKAIPQPFPGNLSQSKSFRVLEANLSDSGREQAVSSPTPQHFQDERRMPSTDVARMTPPKAPQPAPVARPFGHPPGSPAAPSNVPSMHQYPAYAMPPPYHAQSRVNPFEQVPGLFAFFDKSFADKLLQWQTPRSHGQSETVKLVRKMDEDQRRYGGTQ